MFNLRTTFAAIFLATFLVGCKLEVQSDMKVSQLDDPKVDYVSGNIFVEVAGCSDYEDSRRPSDSLLKVQQAMPTVFEGATYVECFRKQFESYAHFDLSLAIYRGGEDEHFSEKHINVISNEQALLFMMVPETILNSLEDIKRRSYGMDDFEVSASFNLLNDTEDEIDITAVASYVDGKPVIYEPYTIPAGKSVSIVLSDVSVSIAMSANSTPVIIRQ